MRTLFCACLLVLASATPRAETVADPEGEVRVPLPVYNHLIDLSRQDPKPAPAGFGIGVSSVDVGLALTDEGTTAVVRVRLDIEVFTDEWTLVPLLPIGVALSRAEVNGESAQLINGPDGLSWSTAEAGKVTMELHYGVDARRSEHGYVLAVPVPRAAATNLTVKHPISGVDLSVVPGAHVRRGESGAASVLSASVPSTASIMVTWRVPSERPYAISRAHYQGTLESEALVWDATFDVEVLDAELITLPLMDSSITLGELLVDGKQATVLAEDGRFATVLQGVGIHHVQVTFQVPVASHDGPPSADVLIPMVPVSHFELTLPGNKELSVTPTTSVSASEQQGSTHTSVYVPMTSRVTFSWVDAVPADLRAQVRANASLYHAVHAEEGVLHTRAVVVYEISRGETNQLVLQIPRQSQVSRIVSPNGGVSDWAESNSDDDQMKVINVYLDRAVSGEYLLDVAYELLLGGGEPSNEAIDLPLLEALDVHRQRGMVALLAGTELTLEPLTERQLSRVGENQLPGFVRNLITMNVAHTYKYTDKEPTLTVRTVAPQRVQGKFDAQIDTLISIGEVTLKGSSSVLLNVKSGSIMSLRLRMPDNVNVFGVTGPSIRTHDVIAGSNAQHIDIDFTQEMEGQFRIEVDYERIMADGVSQAEVPTVSVAEAEVEHGRIAVEALSALEVQASVSEQLSSLDLTELPQQLVLKTTNPILLAYKYVHAEPPFRLSLKITRHEEIDVQTAAIETAHYSTLFTRDGLTVTSARFTVRNSRRQFLRLDLPASSDVWSVFVDGVAEKPAHASSDQQDMAVLVKMKNSSSGFPVEIVYATRTERIGTLGKLASHLPTPDMVVTHTRWDVFLPASHHYHQPVSTMDVVVAGQWVNPRMLAAEALALSDKSAGGEVGAALRVTIPTRGIHYAFEKLYANESPDPAGFQIRYASSGGNQVGVLMSVVGVLLVWSAVFALRREHAHASRRTALLLLIAGVVLLLMAIAYIGTSPVTASALAIGIAILVVVGRVYAGLKRWRRSNLAASAS